MKIFNRGLVGALLTVALTMLARVGFAADAKAPVMLGNEVLAVDGFKVLAGKRVGLITNPSGVNRKLETTIEVLRAAPLRAVQYYRLSAEADVRVRPVFEVGQRELGRQRHRVGIDCNLGARCLAQDLRQLRSTHCTLAYECHVT